MQAKPSECEEATGTCRDCRSVASKSRQYRMNRTHPQYLRILAIAPSTRGFGFAVLEGEDTLVDWGVKTVPKEKNTRSMAKIEEMIVHYRPDVLALQDHCAKGSRRPLRIRILMQGIIDLAPKYGVSVALFTRQKLDEAYFRNGKGTRHARAELIAKKFPGELGFLVPPKRRAWMREDSRMDFFDAVALALGARRNTKWRSRNAKRGGNS